MLVENLLNPLTQIAGNLDLASFEILDRFLENLAQLFAFVKGLECLAQQRIIGNYLFQPIRFQLSLDHVDQGIGGERIQFDALVQ